MLILGEQAMGATAAMANFRSFGDENLAKAEAADNAPAKPGAVLAGYRRPNRSDPREAELRLQARAKVPTALERAGADQVRRSALSADERREQAATLSVALAQPHRQIGPDPRHPWLESPLGRLCWRVWPHDDERRYLCYRAGKDYAKDIRIAKLARGEHVEGLYPERKGASGGGEPTPEDIAAQKIIITAADAVVAGANGVLIDVARRLPRAMEGLCGGIHDPAPYDEGILEAGLCRLAVYYENSGKGA
jgi:hypothetical protein